MEQSDSSQSNITYINVTSTRTLAQWPRQQNGSEAPAPPARHLSYLLLTNYLGHYRLPWLSSQTDFRDLQGRACVRLYLCVTAALGLASSPALLWASHMHRKTPNAIPWWENYRRILYFCHIYFFLLVKSLFYLKREKNFKCLFLTNHHKSKPRGPNF